MVFRKFTCCFVAAFMGIFAASPKPASADSVGSMALPATAQLVSDDTLATVIGKYIPPGDRPDLRGTALQASPQVMPQVSVGAADLQPQSVVASPLSGASGSGNVVYFGITMVSTWNVGSGAQAAGDAVGMSVGVDARNESVTVTSWSSSTNGGVPASQGGDAVAGTPPLANLSNGVGQSIQVAGNGNAATNEATITYGGKAATTLVPTVNTCGTQCTETVGSNALSVAISTSRGVISQSIGNGLVTQNVQAFGDMNHIVNQLGVQVQAQQTSGALNLGSVITSIPAYTRIP